MLERLTRDLAAAVIAADAKAPVARNKRTGEPFSPGLGPHSETETLDLVLREAKVSHRDFYHNVAGPIPYPTNKRWKCDLRLDTSEGVLFVEGKLLRMMGDNGKPNDNMLMHILSPYPHDHSALTDCIKLSSSGFDGAKAIVIVGYEYPKIALEPAIAAFERLASESIGMRHEASFAGLCHPVHTSGKVIAWQVR